MAATAEHLRAINMIFPPGFKNEILQIAQTSAPHAWACCNESSIGQRYRKGRSGVILGHILPFVPESRMIVLIGFDCRKISCDRCHFEIGSEH